MLTTMCCFYWVIKPIDVNNCAEHMLTIAQNNCTSRSTLCKHRTVYHVFTHLTEHILMDHNYKRNPPCSATFHPNHDLKNQNQFFSEWQ
jgi:hypothetical protein